MRVLLGGLVRLFLRSLSAYSFSSFHFVGLFQLLWTGIGCLVLLRNLVASP